MRITCWIRKAANTRTQAAQYSFFSSATIVTQTRLNVKLYVITSLVIPDMPTWTLTCPGRLHAPIIHAMDFSLVLFQRSTCHSVR